jgi:hypothetical protein
MSTTCAPCAQHFAKHRQPILAMAAGEALVMGFSHGLTQTPADRLSVYLAAYHEAGHDIEALVWHGDGTIGRAGDPDCT